MGQPYEPLSPDPVYDRALSYLYGLQKFGIKFGLSKTENLLKAFGNPHLGLPGIHIAGTNGKGSVAAMLASIFSRGGYRTGLYTSPHLVDFRERFRIDGRMIPRQTTLDLIEEVRSRTDPSEPPTFFEFVTAMAFLYFSRERVQVAVIETGLGGRLDATNILRPRITVITNLGLEHQEHLGKTLQKIAREKAGIIKGGVPLVSGVSQPSALRIMEEACREKKAPLFLAGRDFQTRKARDGAFRYSGLGRSFDGLQSGLIGDLQVKNAGLAITAALLWDRAGVFPGAEVLREGLIKVEWPGRMEVLARGPMILLDGAHNPGAVKALSRSLPRLFRYRRLLLVVGIMQDKDIPGILKPLVSLGDRIYLTRAAYDRSAAPETLLSLIVHGREKCRTFSNLQAAVEAARQDASPDDLICITGSLFVVGEARKLLLG